MMEAELAEQGATLAPIFRDLASDPRVRIMMLRLTQIGSVSFLAALGLMMLKSPSYFGVVMNVAGRQLYLSARTKICRHQIEGEKMALTRQ